jgi:hypothetical protein
MTTKYYRNEGHMKTKKKSKKQAPKVEKVIDVTKHIQVHMIFDGPNTVGWVHTHGMWELFQLPDLEIVSVSPLFLMADAGRILNHVAQYMVDSKTGVGGAKPVTLGQLMGLSRLVVVRFNQATPRNPGDKDEIASHYTTPRWRVDQVPEMYRCADPKHPVPQ